MKLGVVIKACKIRSRTRYDISQQPQKSQPKKVFSNRDRLHQPSREAWEIYLEGQSSLWNPKSYTDLGWGKNDQKDARIGIL